MNEVLDLWAQLEGRLGLLWTMWRLMIKPTWSGATRQIGPALHEIFYIYKTYHSGPLISTMNNRISLFQQKFFPSKTITKSNPSPPKMTTVTQLFVDPTMMNTEMSILPSLPLQYVQGSCFGGIAVAALALLLSFKENEGIWKQGSGEGFFKRDIQVICGREGGDLPYFSIQCVKINNFTPSSLTPPTFFVFVRCSILFPSYFTSSSPPSSPLTPPTVEC